MRSSAATIPPHRNPGTRVILWLLFVTTPAWCQSLTLTGGSIGAGFGRSVAGIGDVDGDGRDDIVVGSPGEFAGAGMVMCRRGISGTVLWIHGWFNPAWTGAAFGTNLAAVGDTNGDGVSDVVVGAPGVNSNRGAVHLLSGSDGALLFSDDGGAPGDRLGDAVTGVGDVTGDGVPDYAAGAPGDNSSRGSVRVFNGATGAVIRTWMGEVQGATFGESLGGGHDLNGNGTPDIIVGSPAMDSGGFTNNGRVYIYNGFAATPYATRSGPSDFSRYGASVALMASANRTRYATALIGQPEPGGPLGPGAGTGRVEILLGMSGANPLGLATVAGSAIGGRFGRTVAAVGDLDQDGCMDFACAGAGGLGFARIYSGLTRTLLAEETGSGADEDFALSMAAAGDFNADARPDVIFGSPRYDTTSLVDAGRVLVKGYSIPPAYDKVMISEICWGTPEGVEITNFGAAPVAVQGWTVRWKDGTTIESAPMPSGTVIAPGQSFVIKEPGALVEPTPPAAIFDLFTSISSSTSDIAVALVTAGGVVIDEVHVASITDTYGEGSLGGAFAGYALRHGVPTSGTAGVERVWGIDSNSGGDWTAESLRSFGLENRNSGQRGHDSRGSVELVRITEIDDNPDYLEVARLPDPFGYGYDLGGWYFLVQYGQGDPPTVIRPFSSVTILDSPWHLVLGDGATPPSELPAGVPYIDIAGDFPFGPEEYAVALYDDYGRAVDVVRVTGCDDTVALNHPRAPSGPLNFAGAAQRELAIGGGLIGRVGAYFTALSNGTQWKGMPSRSMGSLNPATTALPAPAVFDVRLHSSSAGDFTLIVNDQLARAGHQWSFFVSVGHLQGTGPLAGLGLDAYTNWLLLSAGPPFSGTLDANGSARLDLPAGTLPPGFDADTIFILQDPGGLIVNYSPILEFDT